MREEDVFPSENVPAHPLSLSLLLSLPLRRGKILLVFLAE
jgi:hypothetical protein